MSARVDKDTMVCKEHGVLGCSVCMVDDFHDWLQARLEKRRQLRAEARATPLAERFDLGGEG